MKKVLILLAFLGTGLALKAQNSSKDVFQKDEIVWYGLDFSKAKLIGQFDQGGGAMPASGSELKAKYIPGWNDVILTEPDKYDLKRIFRKTSVYKDLAVTEKVNSKIDPDAILTYNDYRFKNADDTIVSALGHYPEGDKKEGIGVVFIVEYFDKQAQKASYYVTFFDIASKKVLFREHMFGRAGGVGLRNYWVKTVHDVLTQIDRDFYKMWKKNYGS
jgi:hypothetical protein